MVKSKINWNFDVQVFKTEAKGKRLKRETGFFLEMLGKELFLPKKH